MLNRHTMIALALPIIYRRTRHDTSIIVLYWLLDTTSLGKFQLSFKHFNLVFQLFDFFFSLNSFRFVFVLIVNNLRPQVTFSFLRSLCFILLFGDDSVKVGNKLGILIFKTLNSLVSLFKLQLKLRHLLFQEGQMRKLGLRL